MELRGIITEVLEPKSGETQRGPWKTQEIVVEHGSVSYPAKAVFTLRNAILDKYKDMLVRGKRVTVSFDIDAREWQGRWYNTVSAWKIEELGTTTNQDSVSSAAPAQDDTPFPPIDASGI